MKHKEYDLQRAVCKYLRAQYPNVPFISTGQPYRLTPQQTGRDAAIQCDWFKCPDLLILEPRGGYHGLFIELKTETPYKQDGGIKASKKDHLKLQAETLQNLRGKKYLATFAWDFDQIKQMIDDYFIFGQFLPF